jgi:hypothetical protein
MAANVVNCAIRHVVGLEFIHWLYESLRFGLVMKVASYWAAGL